MTVAEASARGSSSTSSSRTAPARAQFVRFDVETYHRMIRDGVFAGAEPVELLEGWVVYRMGHNPPHDVAVKLATQILDRLMPGGWHTRVQSAITTSDSEPLPDVAVVKGTARDYIERHPGPADIVLLVEVSDTSLDYDRAFKRGIYARAAIAVYWIVNLQERVVEVHTDPSGPVEQPTYRTVRTYGAGETIALAVGGQTIEVPVREMLP